MPHIVESCPLTKLNDGLSRLHSALFTGWPIIVLDMHTRRRSRLPGKSHLWTGCCLSRLMLNPVHSPDHGLLHNQTIMAFVGNRQHPGYHVWLWSNFDPHIKSFHQMKMYLRWIAKHCLSYYIWKGHSPILADSESFCSVLHLDLVHTYGHMMCYVCHKATQTLVSPYFVLMWTYIIVFWK